MNRELIRSRTFVRVLRRNLKKHPEMVEAIEQTLEMLSQDAVAPRLKSRKLKGDLDGVWACSVGYDLRILFEFVEHQSKEAILLLTMGTHDEVY